MQYKEKIEQTNFALGLKWKKLNVFEQNWKSFNMYANQKNSQFVIVLQRYKKISTKIIKTNVVEEKAIRSKMRYQTDLIWMNLKEVFSRSLWIFYSIKNKSIFNKNLSFIIFIKYLSENYSSIYQMYLFSIIGIVLFCFLNNNLNDERNVD